MAVEVDITPIGSGFNRTLINTNFQRIYTALQDALSRSGDSPNTMSVDIDMNSNDLLNVGNIDVESITIGGTEFLADEITAKGDPGTAATITVGTVTTGAAGSDVIITNVGDETEAIFDITIPRGDTGASGPGSGDMVASQNLSDVANAATAFANIKQAATESATGVVELATATEALTGTDTTRAVTSAGLYLPPGHLYGLTLSNNVSDATNDIDIASGKARDIDDTSNMVMLSALTKRLDAAWAVGTGNGGLDTGSIANTTYHVWLIKRSDTGVVDALFSTSASSPTMPANYDCKRRIGSIMRSGGAIRAFVQYGDNFLWGVPLVDFNGTPDTSATTLALTLPTGVVVTAQLSLQLGTTSSSIDTKVLVTALTQNDTDPASIYQVAVRTAGDNRGYGSAATVLVPTDTSAQVRYRRSGSVAGFSLQTFGWVDARERT
jgi:hypothetical protein